MTDNEIVKALECCTDYSYESLLCRECPYFEYGFNRRCRDELSEDSLALINRQKSEIDRLNELVSLSIDTQNDFSNTITEQKAEIERLKHKYDMAVAEREANMKGFLEELNRWNKETQKARAEAIKEFAERLKPILFNYYDSDIDNLVKEMERERE